MKKGPWESRVGMLLRKPEDFAWAFKPPDGAMYGGQPRVDWVAIDRYGHGWLIEVKQVQEGAKSINLSSDLTPGQRQALDAVSETSAGKAILAVGRGKELFLFDWAIVREDWRARQLLKESHPDRLRLGEPCVVLTWTGKKAWVQEVSLLRESLALGSERIRRALENIAFEKKQTEGPSMPLRGVPITLPNIPRIPMTYGSGSSGPMLLPSTLKPGGFIPTEGKMPKSGPSSAEREE